MGGYTKLDWEIGVADSRALRTPDGSLAEEMAQGYTMGLRAAQRPDSGKSDLMRSDTAYAEYWRKGRDRGIEVLAEMARRASLG